METTRRQARFAGLLYLVLAVTAPLSLVYLPSQLIVAGDPAETATRIAASAGLLRLGIATELFHQAVQVFLLLALFALFKPVSEGLSRQLVILGALVSVPVAFANMLNELAALLVTGGSFSAFDPSTSNGLAYLFIMLHERGVMVVSIFWGLWLFPFGLLVIRSGFIPSALGYLLWIAGAGYVVGSFALILLPQYEQAIDQVQTILVLGEIPIVFWLLIWGAREQRRGGAG